MNNKVRGQYSLSFTFNNGFLNKTDSCIAFLVIVAMKNINDFLNH